MFMRENVYGLTALPRLHREICPDAGIFQSTGKCGRPSYHFLFVDPTANSERSETNDTDDASL